MRLSRVSRVSLLERLECCAVKLAAGGLDGVSLHNKVRGKSLIALGAGSGATVSTAFCKRW